MPGHSRLIQYGNDPLSSSWNSVLLSILRLLPELKGVSLPDSRYNTSTIMGGTFIVIRVRCNREGRSCQLTQPAKPLPAKPLPAKPLPASQGGGIGAKVVALLITGGFMRHYATAFDN
jgi:hypothetical protein